MEARKKHVPLIEEKGITLLILQTAGRELAFLQTQEVLGLPGKFLSIFKLVQMIKMRSQKQTQEIITDPSPKRNH